MLAAQPWGKRLPAGCYRGKLLASSTTSAVLAHWPRVVCTLALFTSSSVWDKNQPTSFSSNDTGTSARPSFGAQELIQGGHGLRGFGGS